jgi:hypothetical protein
MSARITRKFIVTPVRSLTQERIYEAADLVEHLAERFMPLMSHGVEVRVRAEQRRKDVHDPLNSDRLQFFLTALDTTPGLEGRHEETVELPCLLGRIMLVQSGALLEQYRFTKGSWTLDQYLGRWEGLHVATVHLPSSYVTLPPCPWFFELGREISTEVTFEPVHLAHIKDADVASFLKKCYPSSGVVRT